MSDRDTRKAGDRLYKRLRETHGVKRTFSKGILRYISGYSLRSGEYQMSQKISAMKQFQSPYVPKLNPTSRLAAVSKKIAAGGIGAGLITSWTPFDVPFIADEPAYNVSLRQGPYQGPWQTTEEEETFDIDNRDDRIRGEVQQSSYRFKRVYDPVWTEEDFNTPSIPSGIKDTPDLGEETFEEDFPLLDEDTPSKDEERTTIDHNTIIGIYRRRRTKSPCEMVADRPHGKSQKYSGRQALRERAKAIKRYYGCTEK